MKTEKKYETGIDLYLKWKDRYDRACYYWDRLPFEFRSFVEGLSEERKLCMIQMNHLPKRNKSLDFLLTEKDLPLEEEEIE